MINFIIKIEPATPAGIPFSVIAYSCAGLLPAEKGEIAPKNSPIISNLNDWTSNFFI
jgi:hypothetical protein